MKINGLSDVGRVRKNNEDNFAYGCFEDAVWAVVCDGMGGMRGGEVASEMAVEIIKNQLSLSYSPKMKSRAVKNLLESAVTAANIKIYSEAAGSELAGMGTTVVALILKDGVAHIAYDGDSRAYKIGEDIVQLTTDHTYLQQLYSLDKITKEQMKTDSRRHIITRALGVDDIIKVDYTEADIEDGEIILLCTDGLTNCVSDSSIYEICKAQPFDNLCTTLITKANENGGNDNITAVAVCGKEE